MISQKHFKVNAHTASFSVMLLNFMKKGNILVIVQKNKRAAATDAAAPSAME